MSIRELEMACDLRFPPIGYHVGDGVGTKRRSQVQVTWIHCVVESMHSNIRIWRFSKNNKSENFRNEQEGDMLCIGPYWAASDIFYVSVD